MQRPPSAPDRDPTPEVGCGGCPGHTPAGRSRCPHRGPGAATIPTLIPWPGCQPWLYPSPPPHTHHLKPLTGGLGTTAEALKAGTGIIVTGVLLMDQRFWGKRSCMLAVGGQGPGWIVVVWLVWLVPSLKVPIPPAGTRARACLY